MAIFRLERLRSQKSIATSREGSRRVHRLKPIVDIVEERVMLSGDTPLPYVGVAFQPYVKQWSSTKIDGEFKVPYYNSYVSGDASVMNQLTVIAKNFDSVATYSSGWRTGKPPVPDDDLDSNVLVAKDAALMNKAAGTLKLTVSQGIFQQDSAANWDSEIETAIKETKMANEIYPGTVNRLIFSNEYLYSPANVDQVIGLIDKYRSQVPGVAVGVRMNNLGDLTNGSPDLKAALTKLVKTVDFVMVNLYPSDQDVIKGPDASALAVGATFETQKALALKVNPNVKVLIGETGWPSEGVAANDLSGAHSSVANEQAYYDAFTKWADANEVPSYYFEAIDEPWKSNKNVGPDTPGHPDVKPWQRSNGAEGHFGLYTYNSNTDTGQIVAKFPLS
jgi:exo-beta-1,3-glucanase (GH17 family)